MFGFILPAIKETNTSKYFVSYLKRHIDVDGDRHGPLSLQLLNASCDKKQLSLAYATAIKSLELRLMVWDKVYEEISVDII